MQLFLNKWVRDYKKKYIELSRLLGEYSYGKTQFTDSTCRAKAYALLMELKEIGIKVPDKHEQISFVDQRGKFAFTILESYISMEFLLPEILDKGRLFNHDTTNEIFLKTHIQFINNKTTNPFE